MKWGRPACRVAGHLRGSVAIRVVESTGIGGACLPSGPERSFSYAHGILGGIKFHRGAIRNIDPDMDVRAAAEIPDKGGALQPPVVVNLVVS